MKTSRIGWALWALVPVAVLSFHYGPGQAALVEDRAATLQLEARSAEMEAMKLQERAYAAHLEAIAARRAALLSASEADEDRAREATAREEKAYAEAAGAWKTTADLYANVLATLGEASAERVQPIRVAHARALVRSGEIWLGIQELEGLLEQLPTLNAGGPARDGALERTAREELATACYYGARLLRLSGMPAQEWMVESGKARQQFRYLAEQARRGGITVDGAEGERSEQAERHQRNLELVLNLEQLALLELQGQAIPRNSPCNCNMGNRNGNGNRPDKKPNGPKRDARGAGAAEAIGNGW